MLFPSIGGSGILRMSCLAYFKARQILVSGNCQGGYDPWLALRSLILGWNIKPRRQDFALVVGIEDPLR
ncbi:hypothetical protein GGE67_000949 [Rhizobium leucaenae]|nr:hypothetical protein [Rhizobium leucaenae]